jgi:hypothetical protein
MEGILQSATGENDKVVLIGIRRFLNQIENTSTALDVRDIHSRDGVGCLESRRATVVIRYLVL